MNQVIIENKSGIIKLNETVTKQSVGKIIDEIGKLFGATASNNGADFGEIMNSAENGIDTLNIEINSPGGSIFDGYTMYQEIKSLRDRGVFVSATITGMAASMASVICMACDEVSIVPHGRMMIHDASVAASGNAESLRKSADLVDGLSSDIANIYAQKTGMESSEIRDMMKAETWMSAIESVARNFADKISEKKLLTQDKLAKNEDIDMSFTLFKKTSDIEAAQSQIESLQSDLTNLQSELQTSNDLVATHAQSIADLQSQLSAITAERDTANESLTLAQTQIATLQCEVKTAENSAEQKAVELLAQTGNDAPIAIVENVTLTKSRADFNQMNARQKMDFAKQGGKITE